MSSNRPSAVDLDWGGAVVEDGTLTLPLSQEAARS
jgi:hypothetical protein